MTMNNHAVDTNVLVYCHSDDEPAKQKIALTLVELNPLVSSQVLSEYLNVIRRRLKLSKSQTVAVCLENIGYSNIQIVKHSTLELALYLINRYDFQMFDSIIIAAALEAGCTRLYSEDMQHGMIVEKTMKIINPFI